MRNKKEESIFTLSEIQKLVYVEYKKNGYLESWTGFKYPYSVSSHVQEKFDIAELSLVNTEVSEAIEILRNSTEHIWDFEDLAFECSDIIIRVMNFCSRKGIDLQKAILEKNKVNLERGKLHGKTV